MTTRSPNCCKSGQQRVLLAVNKAEGMGSGAAVAEFHELGLGQPYAISAAHGDGIVDLIELALKDPAPPVEEEPVEEGPHDHRIKLAIVGRPNVGKSTLINTLMGEERVIAFDMPGTTRDAIEIDFERDGRRYTLIDTAGLRKRGKVFEAVEKFSVIKTLQAIEASNVVPLMLDAQTEISEQDAHIAGFVLGDGRAVVVAINKWDGLDADQKERIEREFQRKLRFLSFARMHTISALRTGMRPLLKSINAAHSAAFAKLFHAQAHPRAAGRGRAAAAAPQGIFRQDALRAPGRPEPAAGRYPRQRAGCGAGFLPALPGNAFPQRLRPGRHAAADRIQVIAQSLRAGRLTPMSRFWSPVVGTLSPTCRASSPSFGIWSSSIPTSIPTGRRPGCSRPYAAPATIRSLYPDPSSDSLRQAIADNCGVRPEQVFVGNGSDEVLAHVFLALLKHPRPLRFPDISYSFYPVYCGLYGIDHETVPLTDDFRIDPEDYLPGRNGPAGAIIFPNPNAPTGRALAVGDIERIAAGNPDAVVVVDEAYVDFGGESAIPLIARHDNVLVVQTLSKSRSLAGLRVVSPSAVAS